MRLTDVLRQLKTWGFRGVIEVLRRLPHEMAIKSFLMRNARSNANTKSVFGLTIIAPMSGSYSLSKTMRDFVVLLREVGIPHQVFDTSTQRGLVPREDVEPLLTPKSEFNILKYDHVVEMFTSPMPKGLPVKRCRIAFWESGSGILDAFPYLKDSDVVIAMSDFNEEYFRKVLPKNVDVRKIIYPLMPVPPNVPGRDETRRRYGMGVDDFIVFYNFDLQAFWRKNPDGLVRAFAIAFRDCSDAKLVMKTNHARSNADRLHMLKSLAASLGISKKVVFINDYLPSQEIYALTGACDVYAALHRGEGFGLGIAEAMQMGRPVVVTAYSAPLEFCNEDTAMLIPYKLVEAQEGPLSLTLGYGADADINAAAFALRRLYENRSELDALGKHGQKFIQSHFSCEAFRSSVLGMCAVSYEN